MQHSENNTNNHHIIELYTVANEYCLFTEKAGNYKMEDALQYYTKILPLLYLKGSLLPDVELDEDFFGEKFVTEQQWEDIFNELRKLFGTNDMYESAIKGKLIKNSIAEALSDIYQDMKDFVLLYGKGLDYAQNAAVYECKNSFGEHWGAKITQAQGAIHAISYSQTRYKNI